MPDFHISNQGSIVMITPVTSVAKEWVDENVQLDSWQWLGISFAVEHRYAAGLIEGLHEADFELEVS